MAETDQEIARVVKTALAENLAIADLDIDVEVRDGVVYLRGEVDEEPQVAKATETTRRIPGVVDVRNQLVALPLRRPDGQAEVIWIRRNDPRGAK